MLATGFFFFLNMICFKTVLQVRFGTWAADLVPCSWMHVVNPKKRADVGRAERKGGGGERREGKGAREENKFSKTGIKISS